MVLFDLAPPDDASMGPPKFTKKLSDLTINDGEKLELKVKVEGDPEPQITWSKGDKILTSSEVMELKYKGGKATLTIKEVFPEDEGEYTCTALNSIGSVTTSCKLTIKRMFFCKKRNFCYFRFQTFKILTIFL